MHSVRVDSSKVSDTIISEVPFSPEKMGVVLNFGNHCSLPLPLVVMIKI